jgi:hypothetical protein
MGSFFLGCFAFGLIFTVASFLLGAFGNAHLHLPGLHIHGDLGGHVGHVGHVGTGAGHGAGHAVDHGAAHHGTTISPFNVSSISAFITWFGGAGWLLSRYSSLTAVGVTLGATLAGLVGGGIVFVTLARFVFPRLTVMRPEDYRIEGTLARVTSPVQAGGTGEIVYALGGTQHVDGARSVAGEALERGIEVVILRLEGGIAYVERWDRFAAQNQLPPGPSPDPNVGASP